MPANVETMFSVRETPWHGLGRYFIFYFIGQGREEVHVGQLLDAVDCHCVGGKRLYRLSVVE